MLSVLLFVAPTLADENNDPGKTTGSSQQPAVASDKQATVDQDEQSENSDLDKLPGSPQQPTQSHPESLAHRGGSQRIYVENAFTLSGQRLNLVVPFPQSAPNWQERLFLDIRKEWRLSDRLNLTVSDRFNLRGEGHHIPPSSQHVLNEFREGFLSWEPVDRTYLDAGRINLKSGVALGFNPTDFFKTRAVVETLSADPSVLREDRLGTVMLRAQHIWQKGTVTGAFAPMLARPHPSHPNTDLPSFSPSFDRTNATYRLLLKGSVNVASNFSPEFLFYRDGDRTTAGANVTRSFGRKIVAYAEWSGGERSNLVDEALHYGRETGSLPPDPPGVLAGDPRNHFQNDLSVGGSYTTETKITFNFEYHFHQAGFSSRDWNEWFRTGQGSAGSSSAARELWFIRSYAHERQEPVTKHSIFLRGDWVDALVPHLEFTGFVDTDLHDDSTLVQVAADYYLSNAWTIGAQAAANLGAKRSDFGSLPQAASFVFKVIRYF